MNPVSRSMGWIRAAKVVKMENSKNGNFTFVEFSVIMKRISQS